MPDKMIIGQNKFLNEMNKFLFGLLAALMGSPAFSQPATIGSAIEFEGRTVGIAPLF